MRNCPLLLVLLWVLGAPLYGQDLYYWTSEEKIYLMEDHQRLYLEYSGEVSKPLAPNLSRSQLVSRLEKKNNSYFIEFSQEQEFDFEGMIRTYGIETHQLKSMHWGLISDEGIPFYLASKVMYLKNEAFDETRFEHILNQYEGLRLGQTGGGLDYVDVDGIHQVLPLANELFESGMFHYAHPDIYLDVNLNSPSATASIEETAACPANPVDSLYNFQYYLENAGVTDYFNYPYQAAEVDIDIDAAGAWCITKGDTGIVVAVIDQGVEAHEELNNDSLPGTPSRILPGYSAVIASPPQSLLGEPAADSIDHGHGMGVAGIIAASHNNTGVAGVAPKVKILPIQVDIVSGSAAEFADAIMWAWKNGADVINNSWTFNFCTTDENFYPAIKNAIDSATTKGRDGKGCPVIFSSGDTREGPAGTTCILYPSIIPEVITVGAINAQGLLPDYVRYGSSMDLVSVSSPDKTLNNVTIVDRMGNLGYNNDTTSVLNHGNINYSMWFGGTSVSSATVSGVAALVLSVNPDLSVTDVSNILTQNTTIVNGMNFSDEFGYGIVNAQQAVQAAQNTLPVEWLYVRGRQIGQDVVVEWATASELNNDRFVVEKKQGNVFQSLGQISGAGNSSQVNTYSFKDKAPIPGAQIYRLKQIDFDGAFNYSPLVEVFFSSERYFLAQSLLPSSSEMIPLEVYNLKNQVGELRLLDVQGRKLSSWMLRPSSEKEKLELSLPRLSAGIYVLQMKRNGYTIANQKIIMY